MTDPNRFSQIETLWSVVRRAHGSASQAGSAQEQLLERYGTAAKRYLRAVAKDDDAADEIYHDFAVKFLRGDLATASPDRGRFRNFLKTVLFRMAMDYHRGRQRGPQQHDLDSGAEPAIDDPQGEADEQFIASWRAELLSKTWEALDRYEADSEKPVYTVLRLRVDQPDLRSPELAQKLSERLGREISAANVRVMLHRAREKFADLLLETVVHSLESPSADELENELCELKLMDYCQPALQRRDEGQT